MPWCPKCKYEYREGIKECSDCKIPLVDYYPEEDYKEETDTPYYSEEQVTLYEEEMFHEEDDEVQAQAEPIHAYQDKKSKAEDFKSSAYTLLIVGILGIAALVLIELHIIPIYLVAPGKYITYGVMGALFLIFIVVGIRSFASAKKYAAEAIEEDDLTNQINQWCKDNLTKQMIIEKAAVQTALPEEMKYFKYFDALKEMITKQFGTLDASYLEALAEEVYTRLFDED